MSTKGRVLGDFGGTKQGWFTEYSSRSIQIYVGNKGAAQKLDRYSRPKDQSTEAAVRAAITLAYDDARVDSVIIDEAPAVEAPAAAAPAPALDDSRKRQKREKYSPTKSLSTYDKSRVGERHNTRQSATASEPPSTTASPPSQDALDAPAVTGPKDPAHAAACKKWRTKKAAEKATETEPAERRVTRGSRGGARVSADKGKKGALSDKGYATRVFKAVKALTHEARGVDTQALVEAVVSHAAIAPHVQDSEILRTTTQARAEKAVCDGVGATLNSFGTKDQSATAMQVKDVVSAAAVSKKRKGVSQGAVAAALGVNRHRIRSGLKIVLKVNSKQGWNVVLQARRRGTPTVDEETAKKSWDHWLTCLTESGKPGDVVRWRIGKGDYVSHKTGMQSVSNEEVWDDFVEKHPEVKGKIGRRYHCTRGKGKPWWARRLKNRLVCLNKTSLQIRYYHEELTNQQETGNLKRWIARRRRVPWRTVVERAMRLRIELAARSRVE